jgi:hypothetical protein
MINNYKQISEFNNGFAIVENKNHKYSYINENNELLYDIIFDQCFPFDTEGIAKIMLNDKYNFIKKDGTFLFDIFFDIISNFYENEIAIFSIKSEKLGLLNKTGEIILEDKFYDIKPIIGFKLYFYAVDINYNFMILYKNNIITTPENRTNFVKNLPNTLISIKRGNKINIFLND